MSSKSLLRKYLLTSSNLVFVLLQSEHIWVLDFSVALCVYRNAPESFLYCCDFASGAVELVKVCLHFL